MTQIEDIEGIGPAYAAKLSEVGLATVEALLAAGAKRGEREQLAAKTGITDTLILKWVNHADLFRIKGVAGQFAELLEASGVDSVPELAQRNAENLATKIAEVNEAKKLVGRAPSANEVEAWITEAKSLPRVVEH